jgi:transposase InsO family protein
MMAPAFASGQSTHVWSYDFVHHRTDVGRVFRTLNILDKHSQECLAIRVKRKLNSTAVIDALTDLFILRGVPAYIRSDNGPEFIAEAVRDWIKAAGARAAYIEPRSLRENGYCDSFNVRLRYELLNGEISRSLREAQIIIESWRKHYNSKRPHSALGYRPPAPEGIIQMDQRPIMHYLLTWTTQVGPLNTKPLLAENVPNDDDVRAQNTSDTRWLRCDEAGFK